MERFRAPSKEYAHRGPSPSTASTEDNRQRSHYPGDGFPGAGNSGTGNPNGGPPPRPPYNPPPNGGGNPGNRGYGPPGGGGHGHPGGGGYGPPGGGGGHGPPGGGGYGPPGRGGGGNAPWNYGQLPTIKNKVKAEQLPSWDGQYDSAVQYFFEIQETAALGGNIPERMGFWLWKNFEKGSSVAEWYAGLTSDLKAHMRSHYTHFVDTIQRYFLGSEWKQYIQLKYENQSFRQSGHDKETPHQFIMRRILYTRMLLQVPPDSPAEVYYICAKNPVSLASLLNKDSIADSASLQLRTRELQDALIDSWARTHGGKVVTKDNLLSMLNQVGVQVTQNRQPYRSYRSITKTEPSASATAHLAEAEEEGPLEPEPEALPNDDTIIHQTYVTMKRQPPPSRRGPFPFDKCDHIHTTLGKRPAWPCRACGSANHWDKECPMYDRLMAKVKKAMWVEKEDPEEDNTVYTQVYVALLENVETSACVEREPIRDYGPISGDVCELPPPPRGAPTFKVKRRGRSAPGQAVLGTSVLSMQGRLGSMDERAIDLRLDSGADVSLVSKEFLETLKKQVTINKGMKMKLWQLTDKNACLEGYVTLPMFIDSEDGSVIKTEVEAYVVPGMSVDVLLEEDYQLAHEVTVARDLELGTRVSYRSCPYSIKALPVGRTKDFDRMVPSHVSHASYVRAKQHRRAQARRHRKRCKFGEERKTIRAQTDLKITPNSVASLRVEGYFDDERDWLVEKSLLANSDDSFFAIPNVLFSSSFPVVPVMNPTDRPRYIRKGEAVGIITDPDKALDSPKSAEQKIAMEKHVSCLASMVHAMME
ncbi:hypothetical protein FIBSPDRAFT_751523, partial [Athelia psychrophila]